MRFPHQTFLEFFAALFFHRYGTVEALRTEYARDPRGFREVVLLFCGLPESGAEVTASVDDTLEMGKVAMAVELVANARRPPPELVDRVLGEARAAMEEEPTPELVDNLGLIARNRLSAFADQAWGILTAQVDGASDAMDPALLQALILAIARADREDGIQRVIDQFDRLQFARVLPAMTDNARGVLARAVVARRLPPERMQAWIEGLRALFETLFAAGDDAVRGWCGAALARLSRREDFWSFLDGGELPEVPSDPAFGREWRLWGWPRERPVGEAGKRWAFWIALALAREMEERGTLKEEKADLHSWVSVAAHGVVYRRTRLNPRDSTIPTYEPQRAMWRNGPEFARLVWRLDGDRGDRTCAGLRKKRADYQMMIAGGLASGCVVSRVWVTLSLAMGLALDRWLALPPKVTVIFGVAWLTGLVGFVAIEWWRKGRLERDDFVIACLVAPELMSFPIAGGCTPSALLASALMSGAVAAAVAVAGAPILFVALLAAPSPLGHNRVLHRRRTRRLPFSPVDKS